MVSIYRWGKDFLLQFLFATRKVGIKVKTMEENTYPLEVDVLTAEADFKNGAILLDVREPMELGICKIEGSLDIPMGQIPGRLEELPKEGCLLVLCHHGSRSGQVSSFLRTQGFDNAVNVAGGIDAWAYTVEPSLVRY